MLTNTPAVVISPYSTRWPELFDAIRAELLSVFAPLDVAVEHIGSTAVPGLAAKPVIDVTLGADTLSTIEERIELLGGLGYAYVPKYEAEIPMRRYFVKAPPASLRVHLHAVVIGATLWQQHLAFRDALRADQRLRSEYQSLKLRLAEIHAYDKAAYTEAKSPFIRSVLASAVDQLAIDLPRT